MRYVLGSQERWVRQATSGDRSFSGLLRPREKRKKARSAGTNRSVHCGSVPTAQIPPNTSAQASVSMRVEPLPPLGAHMSLSTKILCDLIVATRPGRGRGKGHTRIRAPADYCAAIEDGKGQEGRAGQRSEDGDEDGESRVLLWLEHCGNLPSPSHSLPPSPWHPRIHRSVVMRSAAGEKQKKRERWVRDGERSTVDGGGWRGRREGVAVNRDGDRDV